MPMQVQQEGTMWQTPIKGDFLKRSLNQYQYPTPASHLRHINLFLLEIIRIFHRTGTPFRNDDITISKWSTASGQYSNYFWGKQVHMSQVSVSRQTQDNVPSGIFCIIASVAHSHRRKSGAVHSHIHTTGCCHPGIK